MRQSGTFIVFCSAFAVTIFFTYFTMMPWNNYGPYIVPMKEIQGRFSGYPEPSVFWKFGKNSDDVRLQNLSSGEIQKLKLLYESVNRRIDQERRIFVSVLDTAYVDMAFNLYQTSFKALSISNFLFIGIDSKACKKLESLIEMSDEYTDNDGVCITYFNESEGEVASVWPTKSFQRKTHYKSKIILDTLLFNVSVIIVDLDIVFFKNPLPYLNCLICDIEIQSDIIEGNSGFYIARPTKGAIKAHQKSLENNLVNSLSNQKVLDRVFRAMVKMNELSMRTLREDLFPCGKVYFEDYRVMFHEDYICMHCVLVHNNWIATKEAKIYRFKESGLWYVDVDEYYSSRDRKYLTYENPVNFGHNNTLQIETDALKVALLISAILNRTLILPKFHCYRISSWTRWGNKTWCSLSSFYNISALDAYFFGKYRESVFLNHHLVPTSVKENISDSLLIQSKLASELQLLSDKEETMFVPEVSEVRREEIIRWFDKMKHISVLRFHSLYGLNSLLSISNTKNSEFNGLSLTISSALKRVDYRQLLNV